MSPVDFGITNRKSQTRLMSEAQGFMWESFHRNGGGAGVAMTSGTQYYMLVPLIAGETITKIAVDVQTGGATLSLVKVGLVSTGAVLLASSADVKANFTTTGIKDSALSTPYTPTADGAAYAVIVCTHTGTGPALVRDQTSYDPNVYGANARPFGRVTGQTDIVATAPSAGGSGYWMALVA